MIDAIYRFLSGVGRSGFLSGLKTGAPRDENAPNSQPRRDRQLNIAHVRRVRNSFNTQSDPRDPVGQRQYMST